MSEPVYFYGRVCQRDQGLLWAQLADGSSLRERWIRCEPFELELEDGWRITVDVGHRGLTLEPPFERQGRWREFEGLPESEPFRALAPAPHRRVTLTSASLEDGEEAGVLAEILEERFEEGEHHRAAPRKRPSRVRALRIGRGGLELEGAEPVGAQEPAEPPEERTSEEAALGLAPILFGALALASFGLVAWLAGRDLPLSPAIPDTAVVGLTMMALAIASRGYERLPPIFIHRDRRLDRFIPTGMLYWMLGATGVILLGPA
ncbi:MAG: hypothetical protein OEY14_12785, partial [Myxococcales bacterium]|nr:hypothetical protein [Myxococcales bacterium]